MFQRVVEKYRQLPLYGWHIESKEILKKCISARSELAALKQVGELIPNPTVLINTIPLLEAKVSSEIENIVTTTDKLFQYASANQHRSRPKKSQNRFP